MALLGALCNRNVASGYTVAGNFIEVGASCINCGRIVKPQDIDTSVDANAAHIRIICQSCHGTIVDTVVAIPNPEDDAGVAP
jgi:hypothetical protein